MPKLSILAVPILVASAGASLADPASRMAEYATEQRTTWLLSATVIEALRAQNKRTAALSQADIIELDNAWRAEVGKSDAPTIDPVLNSDASALLAANVEASGGLIAEVFIMDARGLNVATSAVTSDYWQGDEAKFQETYPKGSGAVHVAEIEFDESAQTYVGQVSLTISDPDTGAPIGAVTFGLSADQFF